jgi:hypothetical protein
MGVTSQGYRTCHDTSRNTRSKCWQICIYSPAAKGQCFMEQLPFSLACNRNFSVYKIVDKVEGVRCYDSGSSFHLLGEGC